MVDKVIFSSKKDDWETPQDLFDRLNERFHFTLDAAASAENAKCERFYTKEDDALTKDWDGIVWCNPPYTRGDLTDRFVRKGYEEAVRGSLVVMLLAARTDTKRWHDYIMNKAIMVWFIRGRLQFVDGKHTAAFPSCVVVWYPYLKSVGTSYYSMLPSGKCPER